MHFLLTIVFGFFSINTYANSATEIINFQLGCEEPGAHQFSISSLRKNKLAVQVVWDFRIWSAVQKALGLVLVPPDMHRSEIFVLDDQDAMGLCKTDETKDEISCEFYKPATANLGISNGYDFKITGFRYFHNDNQEVALEIQFTSLDGSKSGKASTWGHKSSNCTGTHG